MTPTLRRRPDSRDGASGTANERPRVVVVAEAFPMRGGIATFAETITADPGLRDAFDMRLLNTARTADRQGNRLVPANVGYALADAWATWRASRHADLMHLQLVADPGLPVLRAAALCLAARAGGAKVIAHSHSATGNAGRPEVATYSPRDRLILRALDATDLVLTVSDVGSRTLRRILRRAPVRTMDNAVDVASYHPRPEATSGAAATGSATVLFVGVVCRRKGVPELARAAAELHRRGRHDWGLVVLGGAGPTPEPEYLECRRDLSDAGLSDALIGARDHDGVRDQLSRADIFVLPSYLEGQPMAILEAMATGVPVVSTAVGATPDLIRNGVEGLIVEPGDVDALADALEDLLSDPVRRASMGRAARRRAELRHDLPHLSQNLATAYREVLGRSALRPAESVAANPVAA